MTVFVVLPAYNEEAVIRPLLLALDDAMAPSGLSYRAVLIDDGSVDATVREAELAVAETHGRLPLDVIRHAENRGLGAGLRTGIDHVLTEGNDDDAIVTLDADLTHPPRLIPVLVEALDPGIDVVIASRYRAGSSVRGVPGFRLLLSEVARLVFRALFPIPGVRDYTCQFRAMRVSTLRRGRFVYGDELSTERGFEAVVDLLVRLRRLGIRAREIGFELDYSSRAGRSKMHVFRTIRTTLALLVRRWVEDRTTWRPSVVRARLAAVDGARLGPAVPHDPMGSVADGRAAASAARVSLDGDAADQRAAGPA
jgi:dolichol-phosphate mannosyltransferase